jgi:metal-sulfur cluster biosynthetic enzyme
LLDENIQQSNTPKLDAPVTALEDEDSLLDIAFVTTRRSFCGQRSRDDEYEDDCETVNCETVSCEPRTVNSIDRVDQIWSALALVTDPEIDESVVSLDFVSEVKVDEHSRVEIEFRLPTYWCAPNFAFLMASDMRDAVSDLDWVASVTVRLVDHFSAELINRGVARNQDFRDAFPGETDDDLSALRQKFLGQAYERRQELLLKHLFAQGCDPRLTMSLRLSDLVSLALDQAGASLRTLYLFVWRKIHPRTADDALAFTTLQGEPVDPDGLKDHLRKIAGSRRNAAFNGFICRSLLAERLREAQIGPHSTDQARYGAPIGGEPHSALPDRR